MEIVLSDIFTAASQFWTDIQNSVIYDAGKVGLGFAAGFVINGIRKKHALNKQIKDLKNGELKSHQATVTQLAYFPISSQGGNAYTLQWQHRMGVVKIEEAVPDKIKEKLFEYVSKAMDQCTAEKPLVMQHLKEVTPEDDYKHIRDAIRNYFRAYFGRTIAEGSEYPIFANVDLPDGYEPAKDKFYAALVYDPASTVKELRVLWLSDRQVEHGDFIKKSNVLIESPNDQGDPICPTADDPALQWVDLYNNTLLQLRESKDARKMSVVSILKGDSKAIPALKI